MNVTLYIWRLMRYQPTLYLGAVLLTLAMNMLPLLPGILMKLIFDSITGQTSSGWNIWTLLVLLFATGPGSIVIGLTLVYVERTLQGSLQTIMRRNVLSHILHHPFSGHKSLSAGEVLSRCRDDTSTIVDFILWSYIFITRVGAAIVAIIVLASISLQITLLVFLPVIALFLIINRAGKRIQHYQQTNQEAISKVSGFLGDIFSGISALKNAHAEESVVARFRSLSETRRQMALKNLLFNQILNAVTWNVANLGTSLLLLVVAQAIHNRSFTVGDLALFIAYLDWVTQANIQFGTLLTLYRQMQVALQRMQQLFAPAALLKLVEHHPIYLRDDPPALIAPVKSADGQFQNLEVKNLTYHYPGTTKGVASVSFSLARGSFTVITGRISSGKTTLLRALLGSLPMEQGEICWNGNVVCDPASFFIPPRCSYTPQVPYLFSLSLKENILLGLSEGTVDLPEVLRNAVMERDVEDLEQQVETLVGPRGVKLSGGQVKRSAAARMFVRNTDLLVIDDLSSALDVETEELLWHRIAQRQDVTCLVVSHRHAALRHADHVIVLKGGGVEAQGALDDLLNSCQEMSLIWENAHSPSCLATPEAQNVE
jgi:ATP-binding cassette subfamily B protein